MCWLSIHCNTTTMKIFGAKTMNLLFIFKIDTLANMSLTYEISFSLFLAIESMRFKSHSM